MSGGSAIVVCTGNICRSPVAETLLTHGLAAQDVKVTSAGTHAMVGSPPAPETVDYIRDVLGVDVHREGVQLMKEPAEAADLILTMTEEQRAWVARLAPRTVRRTYTLLEFSRVLAELNGPSLYASLAELVHSCAPLRQKANARGRANDIADPYGGPPDAYVASFSLVEQASREIATMISDLIPGVPR